MQVNNAVGESATPVRQLAAALREARGGKSIDALADVLEVNRNTLGAYERGERPPEVDFLIKFSAVTGADLAKLLALRLGGSSGPEGEHEKNILEALTFTARADPQRWARATAAAGLPLVGEPRATYEAHAFSEFERVERKGILGSAGAGAENVIDEPQGALAFRRDWLRSKGVTGRQLIVADLVGDSMEPTLYDGDVVVFVEQFEITVDDIYLFCLDGRLFVKRLSYRPGGAIEIISDNRERYPAFPISEKEAIAQRFEVKGRFFWRGGDRLQ